MVTVHRTKRAIAALIVCFKPHVFLTLCILVVIAHSMLMAIKKGTALGTWRLVGSTTAGTASAELADMNNDMTLTMTVLIMIIALIWAAFFVFIVRFELHNELDSLLVLFQCSKRGFRFIGVIAFHVAFLAIVALLVSLAVERSIPNETDGLGADGRNQSDIFGRVPPFRNQIK